MSFRFSLDSKLGVEQPDAGNPHVRLCGKEGPSTPPDPIKGKGWAIFVKRRVESEKEETTLKVAGSEPKAKKEEKESDSDS